MSQEHWSSPNGCHPDCPACAEEGNDEIKLPPSDAVALEFCKRLRAYLSAEHFKELQDKTNALLLTEEKSGPAGYCHSHDHCDANVMMMEAFEECGFDTDPEMEKEPWVMNRDDVQAVWNAAWDIAKKSGFTLDQPKEPEPEQEFLFNADKHEPDSQLTNCQRAANGELCVANVLDFAHNDTQTSIVDTLANIFHLCDRDGIDVDDVIDSAKMHWNEER